MKIKVASGNGQAHFDTTDYVVSIIIIITNIIINIRLAMNGQFLYESEDRTE